jgi:hypothetical protein
VHAGPDRFAAIDRLIVADDPDSRAARDFERLFPEGEHALLMLEAADPLGPAALRAADDLERKLAQLPHVEPHSILTFFRHAVQPLPLTPRIRRCACASSHSGRRSFAAPAWLGDHFLGIALELRVHSPAERDAALADIEAATQPFAAPAAPLRRCAAWARRG